MAKVSLKQREEKREKLVAKYAKKYAELKTAANDAKRSDEERYAARLELQKLPRNANRREAGLSLYAPKDPALRYNGGRAHDRDAFDLVTTLPYKPTKAGGGGGAAPAESKTAGEEAVVRAVERSEEHTSELQSHP